MDSIKFLMSSSVIINAFALANGIGKITLIPFSAQKYSAKPSRGIPLKSVIQFK